MKRIYIHNGRKVGWKYEDGTMVGDGNMIEHTFYNGNKESWKYEDGNMIEHKRNC